MSCLAFGTQAQEVVFDDSPTFHDEAFRLTLSSTSPEFDVYYTLNGSRPTRENAVRYS